MKCRLNLTKGFALLAVLLFGGGSLMAQSKTVQGTVTDAAGPVIGVSVTVQGTTTGTTTGADGSYSLRVPNNEAVLEFNFLGYEPVVIPVGEKTVVDVVLKEDTQVIDDVVVIGYGTARRRDLTGSVASITGESLQAMPVANAAQALQGQMAGVNIVTSDGRPDASVRIRVRGGGSITQSNDPLFIVDGFPVSNINDVPASQIESIDVLKDASSTAIYGARGANGVVIVTTKAPKGDRLSITYNGYVQLKTPTKLVDGLNGYDFVLANWEYAALNSDSYREGWEKAAAIGTYKGDNTQGIDYYRNASSRNPQKDLLGNSFAHSHNLTVSGGNQNTKYSLTMNYVDDDGLKIQSWYKRTNVLAKIQQVITKGLVLDADFRYSDAQIFGNESQASSVGSRFTRALFYRPTELIGDMSASNTALGMYSQYVSDDFDPKKIIEDIYNIRKRNRLQANASLAWTVVEGLTLRSEIGYSAHWNETYQFTGAYAKNTIGVEGGDADLTKTNGNSLRWVNTINYQVQGLGEKHSLNLLAGNEVNDKKGYETQLRGRKYPESFDHARAYALFNQYTDKNNSTMNNSVDVPERMLSYFGRINYSFNDRYLFTATLRADGSSNFAPDNRWGYFPAAAFAWRVSEESFLKDISWIDNLKLRVSFGEAGNDRIDPGLWQMIWEGSSSLGYSYQNQQNSYFVPASTRLINRDLKWETTVTRNVGIDFGLFNNRLRGTIDGYWNSTKDLLMIVNLPTYTGYSTQMANVGETSNKGIEFSLSGDIIRKSDFTLSASFNISFNKNKVESLSNEMTGKMNGYGSGWGSSSMFPANDYGFEVGQPVGMIRGFVQDGIYTTADFKSVSYANKKFSAVLQDNVPNGIGITGPTPGFDTVFPGMIKFKKFGTESSAVNINEADDARIIGNTNPKHTGGFTLNATYKGFDAMVAFNWSYGNDIYNVQKLAMTNGNKLLYRNWHHTAADRYRVFDLDASGNLTPLTTMDALNAANANATTHMPFYEYNPIHSGGIEDGSFLRLNNLTIGYTIPQNVSKKIGMQRLRVYATAYNLLTITNYTGLDPEVDAGTNRNSTYPTPGMDFGAYPRSRTYTFGINVTF